MSRLPAFVVRPEPGNCATLTAACERGIAAQGWPLFVAEPRDWLCPDLAGFAGLLIASGNALRCAGPQLERLRTLPVHAVGEATAAVARANGLKVATVGKSDLAGLVSNLSRTGPLLRLAGEDHIALDPAASRDIATRIVYAMRALPLPAALAERLGEGGIVLLHSATAARHFAGECLRLGIDRTRIGLACLAPRVAAAAGAGWGKVVSAPRPDDGALLATVQRMCQTDAPATTDSQNTDGG